MPNPRYSYEDCFALLEVSPEVTWSELRRAYRRQLQKWHPDKIQYNHIDAKTAENKFNAIQTAYDILEKYYLVHQTLPNINVYTNLEPTPNNKKHDDNLSQYDFRPRDRTVSSGRDSKGIFPTAFFMLFGLVVAVYYIVSDLYQESSDPQNTLTASNESQFKTIEKSSESPHPIQSNTSQIKRTFSYGASMAEVREIQGPPSYINENVWYYGKSYIIFSNGIVANWFQHELFPLNISQTAHGTSNLHSLTKHKKITVGLTKSEVRAIQGEPMQDLVDVWVYGNSKIFFKNDRVVSWINSTLDPLNIE